MERPFRLLESLRWDPQGGFVLLNAHLRRLGASAAHFGFPLERSAVRSRLSMAMRHQVASSKVRLLVDRAGAVSVESAVLSGASSTAPVMQLHRVADLPIINGRVADHALDSSDEFLRHKTTSRAAYDRAMLNQADVDDVLCWNERGELTEATTSNLALRVGQRWITPHRKSGLLPGTLRSVLLADGTLHEEVIPVASLNEATRVVALNSVRGIRRIELRE